MTPRDLSALIRLCRKNGISHFKNDEVEFTLGSQPAREFRTRRPKTITETIINSAAEAAIAANTVADTDVETDGWDSLTLDQKLAWSTVDAVEGEQS